MENDFGKKTEGIERSDTDSVVYAMRLIGPKWRVAILWLLLRHGVLRYNELKRYLKGISNTMLTQSLQELETCGIVSRKQYDSFPLKVEYSLTSRGEALVPVLNALDAWGTIQINIDKQKSAE